MLWFGCQPHANRTRPADMTAHGEARDSRLPVRYLELRQADERRTEFVLVLFRPIVSGSSFTAGSALARLCASEVFREIVEQLALLLLDLACLDERRVERRA